MLRKYENIGEVQRFSCQSDGDDDGCVLYRDVRIVLPRVAVLPLL